ncbi:MAG: hypothetical protein NXI31_05675 [bacterium]|nr:hypothetical protein [bacterium]
MSRLPSTPDDSLAPFAPAATRTLEVFGAPVELAFVPERGQRQGRVDRGRPAFAASPARRIVATESLWRDDDLALTPNKYPFAEQQRLLWPRQPRREPDAALWTAAIEWGRATNGTVLANTIGAAATIAWAHLHLTPERLDFLPGLAERVVTTPPLELPTALRAGVEVVSKELPCCVLGLRSADPQQLAMALTELAASRLCAATNVCIVDDTAWSLPRSIEIPAPHFPFALGAAELWGRWCYVEEAPFRSATGTDLERALVAAGRPAI